MPSALLAEENTPGCYLKARYVLALMTALATLNVYSLRNGINMAIVAMVEEADQSDIASHNISSSYHCAECFDNNTKSEADQSDIASHNISSSYHCAECFDNNTKSGIKNFEQTNKFEWTLAQQTTLLGSYYYGYCITNLPGAWMAKQFGIRFVLGFTSLFSSFLTLWIPSAAKTSFELAVTLRAIVGFMQGVTFPVAITGWGIWAPPLERSRLIAATYSGVSTGVFIVYPFAGLLISSFGWEVLFYVTGGAGCLYSVIWLMLIHDSPVAHPRISKQEREYIETSIFGQKNPEVNRPIPWLAIMTSLPVWATVSAHLSANWTTTTLTILIPTYIANVYGFDIKSIGFLAAAPFILSFFFMICGSFLTDFILKRQCMRRIVIRKLMSSMPLTIVAFAFLVLANVDQLSCWAVMVLGSCMASLGLATSGHVCSFVDIAPRYGGIIYSCSNTLVAVMGFVSPQIAGAFITDIKSASSWQSVFWISAMICLFGAVVFGAFASDQVQVWAQPNCDNSRSEALLENEPKKDQLDVVSV